MIYILQVFAEKTQCFEKQSNLIISSIKIRDKTFSKSLAVNMRLFIFMKPDNFFSKMIGFPCYSPEYILCFTDTILTSLP